MPDLSTTKQQKAKFTYHTEERDQLAIMAEKYKCSPFSGECYTQEVSLQKIGKTYHIILSEQQVENEFGEDFIIEETAGMGKHRSLLMIKPTLEDNHYIFFRRK